MSINVLVNSVNLAINGEDLSQILLIVELGESPKLPENSRVLVSSVPQYMTGFIITALLGTLEVPSLGHIRQVPAVLDVNENNWTLTNFVNETKQFNTTAVVDAINAVLTANQPSDAAPSEQPATPGENQGD
jgi:hypothetical protein